MKIKIKKIIYKLSMACCMAAIVLLVALIAKKADVKMDNYMVVGDVLGDNYHVYDFFSQVDEDDIATYNTTFTSKNITTTNMLKLIEVNGKKDLNGENVSIKDVILKSNYVSYVVGNSDITSKIKVDKVKKEIIFDEEVLTRQLNISGNNIYNIVETIKEYNKYTQIILIGPYQPFIDFETSQIEKLENIFLNYNDILREIAQDSNVKYVDISSVSDNEYLQISDYTVNKKGSELISDKIYACAINDQCN